MQLPLSFAALRRSPSEDRVAAGDQSVQGAPYALRLAL